jgi:hypothetical protein
MHAELWTGSARMHTSIGKWMEYASYQYEERTVLSPLEYRIWILGLFKYNV